MATAAQEHAFTSGAGGVMTMWDVHTMFALMASSLILLFAGWVVITQFKAWVNKGIDFDEFIWTIVRVLILVIVYGYFIRP